MVVKRSGLWSDLMAGRAKTSAAGKGSKVSELGDLSDLRVVDTN